MNKEAETFRRPTPLAEYSRQLTEEEGLYTPSGVSDEASKGETTKAQYHLSAHRCLGKSRERYQLTVVRATVRYSFRLVCLLTDTLETAHLWITEANKLLQQILRTDLLLLRKNRC